jgi:membrane-bound metal-dependent hydrolase YbcI (DUF457 family)
MDPVSHAILGRTAIAAIRRDDRPCPGIAAASVLGALSPDVDFVLMPVGWDIYLRAHEIGTHSVAGVIITGLASAGLVRMVRRGSRYRWLAMAAVIGSLTHLMADIASGARIRPGWPLFDGTTSLPLVAMGDPGPIAILLIGAILIGIRRSSLRRIARVTLALLLAFLCFKGSGYALAVRRASSSADFAGGKDRVVEARWATLDEWYAFDRTPDALRQWKLTMRSEPLLVLTERSPPETPLAAASRQLDTVRNFFAVHRLALARVRDEGSGNSAVLWSDLRYCWKADGAGPLECGLWFGGLFDANGNPVRQQVWVGNWLQERPARAREASP